MRDTTVTILRGGNNYPANVVTGADGRAATGILVQVDQVSEKEMVDLHPIYEFYGKIGFKIKTQFWNLNALVKQDDYLYDERYADPDTGANYLYRVIGRPKDYQYDHQEILCDVTVGN